MEESIHFKDNYSQKPTFSLHNSPVDNVATLVSINMKDAILFQERTTFKISVDNGNVIRTAEFKQGFHNISHVLLELSQKLEVNVHRFDVMNNSNKCEIISVQPFELEGMGNNMEEMKNRSSDWSYLGFSNHFVSSIKLSDRKYGLISVNTIGNKNDPFHINICEEGKPDISLWKSPSNNNITFSGVINQGKITIDKERNCVLIKNDVRELMIIFTSIGNRDHYYTLYTGICVALYLEDVDMIQKKLSLFGNN